MASISKRASGAWQNTSYGIRGTATDTIATLPTTIYSDGTNATVSIKGNTTQSGTPTPDSPIMPEGTGERTGNLADLYGVNITSLNLTFRTVDNMKIVVNGTKDTGNNVIPIKTPNIIVPAGTYTLKIKMVAGYIENMPSLGYGVFFGINRSTYSQRTTPGILSAGDVGIRTFTLSEDTTISSFDITPGYQTGENGPIFNNATFECWFYAGSDDKPYEPYGYKIPISSADTTTNIYLGEVETTRRIRKLVLDGTETITEESTNVYSIPIADTVTAEAGLSTHFEYDSTVSAGQFRIEAGKAVFGYNDTLANFSTFLAAQYAAGTPVTVWYVLESETTGIVNEPLMKIGDYADEASGVSIPTTDGANTLSVDTTVQPSEVSVNYHGWHMGTVHERTAGQWD